MSFPYGADDIEDPRFPGEAQRAAAAAVWNRTYAQAIKDGKSSDEAEVIGWEAAQRYLEALPPAVEPARPPRPMDGGESEMSAVAGATVELRAMGGERIVFRGVERVVSRGQMLVIARTEHKGGDAITVTEQDLLEAATNTKLWPLIPQDFDHMSGRGGQAGGAIIPESVRVGTDPKTGNPALFGDVAYNLDVAQDVRDGKWLGGSVRLMRGMVDKRTGAKIGTVLGAWSLTNTPQQDDITVNVDFTTAQNGTPRNEAGAQALDTRPEMGHIHPADTGNPDEDHEMATDTAAQITELTNQHTARVAELTAQIEAANTERDALQAQVTELSAKVAASEAGKTTAEQKVTELSAQLTEQGARIAAIELDAKHKADAAAIDLALAGKALAGKAKLDAVRAELAELSALSLEATGEVGKKLRARFDAKLAEVKAMPVELQAKMRGAPTEDSDALPENPGAAYDKLVTEFSTAQSVTPAEAELAVRRTPQGARLFEAMTASR